MNEHRQAPVHLKTPIGAQTRARCKVSHRLALLLIAVALSALLASGCSSLNPVRSQVDTADSKTCLGAAQRVDDSLQRLSAEMPLGCSAPARAALQDAQSVYVEAIKCFQRQHVVSSGASSRYVVQLIDMWLSLADLALKQRCQDLAARSYGEILIHAVPLMGNGPDFFVAGLAYYEHARSGLDVARGKGPRAKHATVQRRSGNSTNQR